MPLRKWLRPWLVAAALLSLGLAVVPAGVASATSAPVAAKPAAHNGSAAAPVRPAAFGAFFELVNPVFGRCVEVIDASKPSELREVVCNNGSAQLWAPNLLGGITVQWRNPFGFCLEAPNDVNGVNLIQNTCDITNPGQQWDWRGADAVGHLVLQSKLPNK